MTSVAVFGSLARLDTDHNSDRDMLVVSCDPKELSILAQNATLLGFQPSTYTYKKLLYMSKKSSLFLNHLKRECVILRDDNNRLKHILINHKLYFTTNKDLQAAGNLFTLTKTVPKKEIIRGWLADVLFTLIRNYGVVYSHHVGNGHFAFDSWTGILSDHYNLNEYSIGFLKELRVMKRHYRLGQLTDIDLSEIISQGNLLLMQLKIPFSIESVEKKLFKEYLRGFILNKNHSKYLAFRMLELYYRSLFKTLEDFELIFRNPSYHIANQDIIQLYRQLATHDLDKY